MLLKNHPYRHWKGELYIAKYIAKDSETLEDIVVYQSCATGEIWVRPLDMFFDSIEIGEETIHRFTPVVFDTEEGA